MKQYLCLLVLLAVASPLAHGAIGVAISPSAVTLGLGSNLQFTATVTGTTNTAVTWKVNSPAVGTVDQTGLYIAPGTMPASAVLVTATAKADNHTSATAVVTLTQFDPGGSVTNNGTVTCAPGGAKPSVCYSLTVSCPQVPNISAWLKVTQPSTTPIGTVEFVIGTGGSGLYDTAFTHGLDAVNIALNAGYQVVQVTYGVPFVSTQPNGWLQGPGGTRRLACRFTAISQWVKNNLVAAGSPYCATGNSAGGEAIGSALTHYGLNGLWDFVEVTSGPPFARQDLACICTAAGVNASCHGGLANLCIGTTTAKQVIDPTYNNTNCSSATTSHSKTHSAQFVSDSVVSPEATVGYPNTVVRFLFGGLDNGSAEIQAGEWQSEITTPVTSLCVPTAPHAMPNDLAGAQQIGNDLVTYCHK